MAVDILASAPARPVRAPPTLRTRLAPILAVLLLATLPSRGFADETDAAPPVTEEGAAVEEERQEAIETHTRRAWKALRSGNHEEVLARTEKLEALSAADPLIPYLRARVHQRTGEYARALEIATKATVDHPGNRAIEGVRFELLLELGQAAVAEVAARAALQDRADDVVAQAALGLALEMRGRDEEALATLRRVIEAHRAGNVLPEELPWVSRASLAATWLSPDPAMDLVPQALNLLRDHIEADPADQDALLAYADTFQQDRGSTGQSTAQKYYRKLLDENPELAEARVGYARYYLVFWQQDLAIQQLERALKTNPRLVSALSLLAYIHVSNGDYEEAGKLIDRALEVAPRSREARAVKAARHWIMGETEAYERVAEDVLSDDPTYGQLYLTISELVGERQRRFDVAADFARKALEIDPDSPRAYTVLGENLMNLGRTDEAQVELRKGIQASKRYSDVHRDNWLEILRHLERFTLVESEHFRIRIHSSEVDVMRHYLPDILEEAWTTLSTKYGAEVAGPIHVDTFHRADDFSVRSIGVMGLPALGVCFGQVITLLGPTSRPVGQFSWSRTAWHEFAHVVTLQMSEGQVPRWLTEGLSVYEEQARRPHWGREMMRELHDRWHSGRLLKMAEINRAFRGSDIMFAYFQGGLIVQHLEGYRGFDVVPQMLRLFAKDRTTEAVFREVLGIELADYDRLFHEFVGGIVRDWRMVPRWDDAAVEDLEKRVAEKADDAEAWMRLAWAHLQRGRSIDAGSAFAKAKALDPAAPDVALFEGRLAQRNRRTDLAAVAYRRFLALGGDDIEARLFLAALEERGGDLPAAMEHLQAAKRCFPFHAGEDSPYRQLATLHRGAGDEDAALAELEAYSRIAPEDYDVRKELREAYAERGDMPNLARICEECIDISPFGANPREPPDMELHRVYAQALLALDRRKEALRELTVQVELHDRIPEEQRVGMGAVDDLLRLGNLLLEMNEPDDALMHALGALRLAPDDPAATLLRDRAREAARR
jgi:tetratricopeptide (TPR) repeat protein